MNESIETLANEISALTQKLDGIGIEIYHLNSAITSLKCSIDRMKEKEE